MSEQLIISQGGIGPQGLSGPQGPIGPQGSGVPGPTGPNGGINFPYSVLLGQAEFDNIGSTAGSFVLNGNGAQFNNIKGNTFAAINFDFISSSASAGIQFNNVTGASYGIWIDNTNGIFQIDSPVVFTNTVIGISGSNGGFGSTGPQGAVGPQGSQGNIGIPGPTGPSLGGITFPYNINSGDALFYNTGTTSGSFVIGANGVGINNIVSTKPASIQISNTTGSSFSTWIDNTNGPIQIDVPITFTNQVISSLYLNTPILIEDIYGGTGPSWAMDSLTSSGPASILYTNNTGSSYSLWIDNTNGPVRIDPNVVFGGSVSFINDITISGTNSFPNGVFVYGNTSFFEASSQFDAGIIVNGALFDSVGVGGGQVTIDHQGINITDVHTIATGSQTGNSIRIFNVHSSVENSQSAAIYIHHISGTSGVGINNGYGILIEDIVGEQAGISYNGVTATNNGISYENISGGQNGVLFDRSVKNVKFNCPVVIANSQSQVALHYTPLSTTDDYGAEGSIAYSGSFSYIKTGDGWQRFVMSSF